MPRFTILDTVRTPDGKVGKVTEFDQVDGHTVAKVRFGEWGLAFQWYRTSELTRV
jgi:hypothetical protein